MGADEVLAAAQSIVAARRARTPLAPLPAHLQPKDEAAGYEIQHEAHWLLAEHAGDFAGYKIGCTSQVMQDYIGIPHPCAGGVFAGGVHASGVTLRAADFVRVGVECEIAVRLAKDLLPLDAPFTIAHVGDAIGDCHAAIEIVDDRYVQWETMGAPTLVADDFFAAGCVLGPAVPREAAGDLAAVQGRAFVNDALAGQGSGADVLGHPLHALAWLANHLASRGDGLEAGQLVLTGSLVKTLWLKPGDRVRMELDGLGVVEAVFA
ncbi:putative hydratase/decarboxylase; putative 4-oxalocrotonate decarboxylase [Bradyrhizobium sp. ORS 278]|uniref:2-keto-4-pentenoate hydratase n=1 Tax=Bradyrhizobium sp. (strain ORS 278) TaxID=114615 RepID=UPI0001508173|nr:fumarylacetoacetate hydrolase family protein [Bradyrhizobium sp. ORS 278]CAL78738.1 putative hydratase/decarboxylase; putative 4-oxalocrotonate decarboxylase [Bradyrhizobium sp. ORS 278]